MAGLTISEVACELGLRPSALRYYERVGILPPARRISGQRRYDESVFERLAIILRAQQTGFTLTEISELFGGFPKDSPPSERWRELSERKLKELSIAVERIKTMQNLLRRMKNCRCEALDECGRKIIKKYEFQAILSRLSFARVVLSRVGGRGSGDRPAARCSAVSGRGRSEWADDQIRD